MASLVSCLLRAKLFSCSLWTQRVCRYITRVLGVDWHVRILTLWPVICGGKTLQNAMTRDYSFKIDTRAPLAMVRQLLSLYCAVRWNGCFTHLTSQLFPFSWQNHPLLNTTSSLNNHTMQQNKKIRTLYLLVLSVKWPILCWCIDGLSCNNNNHPAWCVLSLLLSRLVSLRLVLFWLGAGIVTHFYGDALMNYHTTLKMLGSACLLSACLSSYHAAMNPNNFVSNSASSSNSSKSSWTSNFWQIGSIFWLSGDTTLSLCLFFSLLLDVDVLFIGNNCCLPFSFSSDELFQQELFFHLHLQVISSLLFTWSNSSLAT